MSRQITCDTFVFFNDRQRADLYEELYGEDFDPKQYLESSDCRWRNWESGEHAYSAINGVSPVQYAEPKP